MSVVKLNPVDGLPEWKGRKVVPEWRKRRDAKRARRFIMIEWGELAPALGALHFTRAQRLLFVLFLHRHLQRTHRQDGWTELERKDLVAVNLADSNLYKATHQLKTLGLVEVQRRPGKRPLLRLVKPRPGTIPSAATSPKGVRRS
jgi:hypothetical protein